MATFKPIIDLWLAEVWDDKNRMKLGIRARTEKAAQSKLDREVREWRREYGTEPDFTMARETFQDDVTIIE